MAGLDPAIQSYASLGMTGYVYMMASKRSGTLYIGVTSDLIRRIQQHREQPEGFIARYAIKRLVWYETLDTIELAIQRETSLKRWKRSWKLDLIEAENPEWLDRWNEIAS